MLYVEHGTKKALTGKEVDELVTNAEKYLKRVKKLFSEIETSIGMVDFCSVHLEACCGIKKRVEQFEAVLSRMSASFANVGAGSVFSRLVNCSSR